MDKPEISPVLSELFEIAHFLERISIDIYGAQDADELLRIVVARSDRPGTCDVAVFLLTEGGTRLKAVATAPV